MDMMKRMMVIGILVAAIFVAAGCRGPAAVNLTATPEPTATDEPPTETSEPSATATDVPTETSTATNEPTEEATPTDELTATEEPTATDEPTPTSEADEDPTPTAESEETEEPAVPDMVPAGQSVWQLDNDPYNKYSTEACGNTMDVDFYGLVAIEKVGDGVITWTVPDGTTYTLQRTEAGKNSYWGIGRAAIGGHDLTIGVLFTTPESLGVTYTLIPDGTEECYHVFQYNAVRAW